MLQVRKAAYNTFTPSPSKFCTVVLSSVMTWINRDRQRPACRGKLIGNQFQMTGVDSFLVFTSKGSAVNKLENNILTVSISKAVHQDFEQ